MKILLGAEPLDRGEMILDGKPYAPRSPKDARLAGVAMVPQERTLCGDLTVWENIVLPSLEAFVRRDEMRAIAQHALDLVTARIRIDELARDLSVADQQLVEIARALAARSRVLILDEPTSSLGRDDAEKLFDRIAALKNDHAIVLVTHFLGDVRAHADRYTVLRDGEVRGEGDARTTPPEQIVHEMLGRELEARKAVEARARHDEVALARLDLRKGEIFGIAGLVGSGRTSLLRALLRENPRSGLLSEDRGGEGLMLRRSIADNVTLSPRSPIVAWPESILAEGARFIDRLGIRTTGPDQNVEELSGGNQQKVQLARMLREDYDVFLADEPTRGIDVASKAQILDLFRELAARGKSIVMVSSEWSDLTTTCDRIAVLRRGTLGPARPASECTEQQLLLEASS
jgi:ribose transport system ATP-binding protein